MPLFSLLKYAVLHFIINIIYILYPTKMYRKRRGIRLEWFQQSTQLSSEINDSGFALILNYLLTVRHTTLLS